MRKFLVVAAFVAFLGVPSASAAPDLLVGVIASRGQPAGAAQTLVATAWAAQLRAAGGVFGREVRLLLGDDGGSPNAAVAIARQQVESGALAIVCCTTPQGTRAVAEYAEEAGIPLLAPSAWDGGTTPGYWAFSLAPSDTDALAALVADAYRRGRSRLALMAPDTPATAAAARDLEALGALVGIDLVEDLRYPPGQQELRPEALLVAASHPGAVVVWGEPADLARSVDALHRRGYEGAAYGRTAALYPGAGTLALRSVTNVMFAVPPAAVVTPSSATATVAPGEREGGVLGTCAEAAGRDAARLRAATNDSPQPLASAPVLGGLDLLAAAFEQLLALQLPLTTPQATRQVVRDALVGLPATCTGAGALDPEDGRRSAVKPRSLAIGTAAPTGLVAR